MKSLVRFGVILHHMATLAGWLFCLVLLAFPHRRSMLGFLLLLVLTFTQTIASLELIGRWLLGRLNEKEQRMQQSASRWCEAFGETAARRIFAVMLIAMVAFKLALPAVCNSI
ncbi:hypothetical protein [Agathobaculum desmolans]|mgnify:FL=1|uniref:hypothetical protein n=1 Tax=Agathobaculum desmolans TaxID=39484 RepID=UPI00248DC072|nr:hypothetical protein [Agathobaculum desmolans]